MPFLDTPHIDTLPPYSPPAHQARDPETASVRSSAPSYHSEPPAYEQVVYQTSTNPSSSTQNATTQQQRQRQHGLPRLHYAPGFVPRPTNPFSSQNYSFVSWSSTQRNPRTKHYENVARRRVQENELIDNLAATIVNIIGPPRLVERQLGDDVPSASSNNESAEVQALLEGSLGSPTISIPTISAATQSTTLDISPPSQIGPDRADSSSPPPLHPHEDPDLVGPAAAERTRSQRLYREEMLSNPALALQQESAGWDFMLAQSSDWQERQTKWKQFHEYRQWGWKGVGKRVVGLGK